MYLLTAHAGEAAPFIARYGLERKRCGGLDLWCTDDLRLLITGQGEARTVRAVESLLRHVASPDSEQWMNFGLAGSAVHGVGELVRVNRVVNAVNQSAYSLIEAKDSSFERAECLTVAFATHHYPPGGVIDQEAFHIASKLNQAGALDKLQVFKLVGDGPNNPLGPATVGTSRRLLAERASAIADLGAMISH